MTAAQSFPDFFSIPVSGGAGNVAVPTGETSIVNSSVTGGSAVEYLTPPSGCRALLIDDVCVTASGLTLPTFVFLWLNPTTDTTKAMTGSTLVDKMVIDKLVNHHHPQPVEGSPGLIIPFGQALFLTTPSSVTLHAVIAAAESDV